jgi:primosomal protein N' (replication factor Y)
MPNSSIDKNQIFRIALALPINHTFDYSAPENIDLDQIKPGIRVRVPFANGEKIGVLVELAEKSAHDVNGLKQIAEILDEQPLLNILDLKLLHWASQYYHHPLGEVIMAAFPALLREGKPANLKQAKHYALTDTGKSLDSKKLQRAPKQKALLEFMQSLVSTASTTQLSTWQDNWRPALKQLLIKKILQETNQPASTIPKTKEVARTPEFTTNSQQQKAIDTVCHTLGHFQVFLLEGVTGSGKTEVYMQIIHQVLARGEQVLVLLPEITLTPQLEERFRRRFTAPIAIFHSRLSKTQRLESWLQMQQGKGSILLGTRSALFTPLIQPGLIILDEEHDNSFKQQEGFRFSARDVAVVRGKMLNIPVLLGTATPSLESLHNVAKKRYQLLHLPERAGNALAPTIQLMDIRNQKMQEGLSEPLLAQIKQTLEKKEQVLIFLNRRGYAPVLMCHSCGWIVRCHRCDANLVIHYAEKILRCHHCAQEQRLLQRCLSCKTGELTPIGLGTERIEKALQIFFPQHQTIRMDRDTTQRKGELEKQLEKINSGQADIILGTQMLAKGHHFPNVTLVTMLDVDSGLFGIDYHAPEKLAQMIVQVSGRAGRAEKPGKVILQTRKPDHPLLLNLIHNGYSHFANSALAERQAAQLPPFSHQALLRVLAIDKQMPQDFLQAVVHLIQAIDNPTKVLGPVPAPMAKRAGRYHFQLLLQSYKRQDLHHLLDFLLPKIEKIKLAKKVRWSLDVDPIDLF